MRSLELALVVGIGVGFVALAAVRRPRWVVASGVAVLVAGQALVEGGRWQLWPAWVAAALVVVADLAHRRPRRLSAWRIPVGVGLAAVLAFPLVALPVPRLPVPDGPHRVGTMVFHLTDPLRPEVYGSQPGEPRQIAVQAWFPTDATGTPASWAEEAELRAVPLARFLGFPPWFLDHLRHTRTHSIVGAPPRAGRWPVVVYSHGWRGFRTITTDQAERLASHGFVVVAPDHTHAAVATRLADGTVVEWDPTALPSEEAVGQAAFAVAAEALVATFVADLQLTLDAFEDGRLGEIGSVADLGRVGVYGHSTGGGAAVSFCLVDRRCDAVAGHDAWVLPIPADAVALGLGVPALFQRSDGWRGTENDRLLRQLAESAPIAWWQGIVGAGHNDFVVTPLFSPFAGVVGLKGPIPADRVVPLVSDQLVAFMERSLGDGPGAALDRDWGPDLEAEVIADRPIDD
jgi:dienelactone hydrolase